MAVAAGIGYDQAGYFYSIATITSAVLLALLGRYADFLNPRTYGLICAGVFTLAALTAMTVSHPFTLVAAVILVRWSGQGLLSHASSTALAKRFPNRPGAAFALTSLGFPIGEAILPLIVTALLAVTTFHFIWGGIAGLSLIILIPATFLLGRVFSAPAMTRDDEKNITAEPLSSASGVPSATGLDPLRNRVWRDSRLWLLLPHLIAVAFTMTGLLFYQTVIGASQGWSAWWWASGLSVYAVVRAICSLGAGDWLKSRDSLPLLVLSKLPVFIGTIALVIPGIPAWALLIYFPLCGASLGCQMVITRSALLELYGPDIIGAAKSATTALMILSTAAAPAIYGWLGTRGLGSISDWVLIGNTVLLALALIFTQLALPALRRRAKEQGNV
jgi:MFS family permease